MTTFWICVLVVLAAVGLVLLWAVAFRLGQIEVLYDWIGSLRAGERIDYEAKEE